MIQQVAPYFGYLASLCLILALLINNDLKFRWFNTFGNIAFITYAILLGTIPVLITNVVLFVINIFYLIKIYRRKENFDLLEFKGDEKLAQKFIEYYRTDILKYFPAFTPVQLAGKLNFVVTRDLVIANMFSADVGPNGDAVVRLNYTLQKFRDYKVGSFIFDKEKAFLSAKGIKRIVYTQVDNKSHLDFLKVMGFKKEMQMGEVCFVKEVL